jgi:hypothetical protein
MHHPEVSSHLVFFSNLHHCAEAAAAPPGGAVQSNACEKSHEMEKKL